jgi:short-subunit dehydrogenase
MKQASFSLALVTGATSGIGEALSRLLAAQGISLILTGRQDAKLEALRAELSKQVAVSVLVVDLALPKERERLLTVIKEQVPDLVINNAGFGLYGEVLSYSTEEQMAILEVNGAALIELSIAAARTWVSVEKRGVIMNIASAAAFYIFPWFSLYSAVKRMVVQFSQAFDVEMQSYGIRVLTACPGPVATQFRSRASGQPSLMEGSFSITAEDAACAIWRQIQQGRAVHIFNWKYRLSRFLAHFLPKRWLAHRLQKQIASYMPPRPPILTPSKSTKNR